VQDGRRRPEGDLDQLAPEVFRPTMPEPNAPPPDPNGFIRSNTRLLTPPLVPEVRLHLAEESLPIWHKTEEELGESGLPPPYWAFAWAGGQALARYLLDIASLVAGRTILDIGSGSGLVAIAAVIAGARHAVANDIDAFALAACRLNAAENDVAIELSGVDLLQAAATSPPPPCDVLVLADLFYEKPLAAAALDLATRAVRAGTTVLVGDPCRSHFPADRFSRLVTYNVPVTRELEDSEIKATSVWKLAA